MAPLKPYPLAMPSTRSSSTGILDVLPCPNLRGGLDNAENLLKAKRYATCQPMRTAQALSVCMFICLFLCLSANIFNICCYI